MNNALLNFLNDIPGMPKLEENEDVVKETVIVHEELTLAMALPEDGEYYIKSATEDRYLDFSHENKEDHTQIIGQPLNKNGSPNQRVC
jgi:hypothetical protein